MFVLVGYATEHGSTREIAERAAGRLRARGHRVDLRPMSEIGNPRACDAAVLGSAIHDGSWLPEATTFMENAAGTLAGRPVWLFSVGMAAALPRPMQAMARKYEPKEIAGYREALTAVRHDLFSGVIQPGHLDRGGRLRFRALGCRYGDYRDWASIDVWADGIADRLADREAAARRT
jgi:menaquinone-dependent protoporphyrinogen oxidase